MPRRRDRDAPRVVHRAARCGLRVTRAQRERLFGLLRSAGDVWCCVLDLNRWRRQRGDRPIAGYRELCRELSAAGPGTFGELDSTGARSVLRRYSDAWFAAAERRGKGDRAARYPRRRRGLVPVRWYHGTFALDGRVLAIPVARGRPPLRVRLDRDVPYPPGQVRSVTLGYTDGRLIAILTDKAEAAGITVELADERGTSSTCPSCARRVPKPAGRVFRCPHCGQGGHRDLVAAASIAARGTRAGGTIPAIPSGTGITHRRAGRHLPGVHPARRDPRRRPPSRPAAPGHLAGTGPPPAPPVRGESLAATRGTRKNAPEDPR